MAFTLVRSIVVKMAPRDVRAARQRDDLLDPVRDRHAVGDAVRRPRPTPAGPAPRARSATRTMSTSCGGHVRRHVAVPVAAPDPVGHHHARCSCSSRGDRRSRRPRRSQSLPPTHSSRRSVPVTGAVRSKSTFSQTPGGGRVCVELDPGAVRPPSFVLSILMPQRDPVRARTGESWPMKTRPVTCRTSPDPQGISCWRLFQLQSGPARPAHAGRVRPSYASPVAWRRCQVVRRPTPSRARCRSRSPCWCRGSRTALVTTVMFVAAVVREAARRPDLQARVRHVEPDLAALDPLGRRLDVVGARRHARTRPTQYDVGACSSRPAAARSC